MPNAFDVFTLTLAAGGSGGGGTTDHRQLSNRSDDNQHPMSAITGLSAALDGKQPSGNYTTKIYVDEIDQGLQAQIDALESRSDVVDVVGTYAELQAYDTSDIKENDIIKVMLDSTHSDAITYYRWVITNVVGAWSYVGSLGPFYTKAQTETKIQEAIANLPTEEWTFTLEDDTTVTKKVVVQSGT